LFIPSGAKVQLRLAIGLSPTMETRDAIKQLMSCVWDTRKGGGGCSPEKCGWCCSSRRIAYVFVNATEVVYTPFAVC